MLKTLNEVSHRRLNPLTGEWVQVSPHRAKRPWQGKVEELAKDKRPTHDVSCYLCPGNTRANGMTNPDYTATYAFVNDFSALQQGIGSAYLRNGLLEARTEEGCCKVICFSPRHDLTLALMSPEEIKMVIHTWMKEYTEIGRLEQINHIQIFENKGEIMGCSNPHPHGQIWAQQSIPQEALKKDQHQWDFYEKNRKSLLSQYLNQELEVQLRILHENDHMVVLVPFWAVWPYETMIIPKRPMPHISEMTAQEVESYAAAIKWLTVRYDNLFNTSFPYSSGIHQAPTDGAEHPHWHWHMSFYPPLLRSATVKKFMVGYEMFGNPQRDITAEQAAEKLKNLSGRHYLEA